MGDLGALRTEPFAGAIALMGKVPAAWLRYVGDCPHCRQERGRNTPSLDCTLCGGTGKIYESMTLPTTGATGGKLLLQQVRVGRTKAAIDLLQGDLTCSYMENEYPLGEGDRFRLPDRQERVNEFKLYSGSSVPLKFGPVLSIASVWGPSGAIASGSYAIGADQRSITFTGGIASGQRFSVAYFFRPSFFVVQGSIHRRVTASNGDPFPNSVILRLFEQSPTDTQGGSDF